MAKKIYDIKPPKKAVRKTEKAPKKEKIVREIVAEDKIEKISAVTSVAKPKKEAPKKTEKKSFLKPLIITCSVLVLFVCVYLFFKLPKADIEIWPKVDAANFQQTVVADKTASMVDATKNVIPAQYFETTKTGSEDFPATGSADNVGKASGIITVFNKMDPVGPFTLKAGTHFVSDSGKLFVSLQKIVIPAAKKVGSKITAGSIKVTVQAVDSGTDYNIPASNFSVPGLKGTNYYFNINATSSTAMAGGYTGKVKQITDDDIQGAKDVLTKKLTDNATAELKKQITSDYILVDNALTTNVTSASTQAKAGTVSDKFTYQANVKASALAFKKSDLDEFVKDYIVSQMPQGKNLLDNSTKNSYTVTTADISGGKITMNLTFSAGEYQNVDVNSLALSLLGENSSQISQTINSTLGGNVPKINVKFWPFWVSKVPNSQKAIHIYLKFN